MRDSCGTYGGLMGVLRRTYGELMGALCRLMVDLWRTYGDLRDLRDINGGLIRIYGGSRADLGPI